MFPSFVLFGREIHMYGIMAALGALVAGFYACRAAKRSGEDDNDMIMLLLIAGGGVLLGSHLLYGLLNIGYMDLIFKADTFKEALKGIGSVFGGGVFYGGLIGGAAAGLIYIKVKKFSLPLYTDICAGVIPLFHVFGRIGCFLGGCCYGIESKLGFVFTDSIAPGANGVTRFPVQLLESGCNLIIFAVIAYLFRNGKLKGRLMGLYLTVYAVVRFLDEFLRGDVIRGFALGLSTSQWISIGMLILGVILLSIRKKEKEE